MKAIVYIDYKSEEVYIPLKNGNYLHCGLYIDYPTITREVDYKIGTPSSAYVYHMDDQRYFSGLITVSDKPKKKLRSVEGLQSNDMYDKLFPPIKTVSGILMKFNFDRNCIITKDGVAIPHGDTLSNFTPNMFLGYIDNVYVYNVDNVLVICDTKKVVIHEGNKEIKNARLLINKLKIKYKNDDIPPIDIMD